MKKHIDDLHPDEDNVRLHGDRNLDLLAESLRVFGPARPIVVDEHDTVLAGNGVLEAAREVGIERVRTVEVAGDEIVAVQVRGLTEDQKRQYAVADNRAAELSVWDTEKLADRVHSGLDISDFFHEGELVRLIGQVFETEEEAARAEELTRKYMERDARLTAETRVVVCPYCYHEWEPTAATEKRDGE